MTIASPAASVIRPTTYSSEGVRASAAHIWSVACPCTKMERPTITKNAPSSLPRNVVVDTRPPSGGLGREAGDDGFDHALRLLRVPHLNAGDAGFLRRIVVAAR